MADMRIDSSDSKDVHSAVTKITPFFHQELLAPGAIGEKFKDSLILKQSERARHWPDKRSHLSNKTRPDEFWKEFDHELRAVHDVEDLPAERDLAIRPIIARRMSI